MYGEKTSDDSDNENNLFSDPIKTLTPSPSSVKSNNCSKSFFFSRSSKRILIFSISYLFSKSPIKFDLPLIINLSLPLITSGAQDAIPESISLCVILSK